MFDVGFWELILIFGVGLMILGPERMPRVASQIGRWVGRARRTASSLRRQLEQEIASADAPASPLMIWAWAQQTGIVRNIAMRKGCWIN